MKFLALLIVGVSTLDAINVTRVCASGCNESSLATALTNAKNRQNSSCADSSATEILILTAGETYTGNFVLPARNCSYPIILRSSRLADLPADDRVAPGDAASMPVIVASTGTIALQSEANPSGGVGWIRIEGIEIRKPASGTATSILQVGRLDVPDSYANLPHRWTIDRSYIHGAAMTDSVQRCVDLHGFHLELRDSYVSDCIRTGLDSGGVYIELGRHISVRNNYLSGGSEDLLTGGSGGNNSFNNSIRDLEVIGNQLTKPFDWKWRSNAITPTGGCNNNEFLEGGATDYVCDTGAWVTSGEGRGHLANVKNNLEFKRAFGAKVYGNVLGPVWTDGQSGMPFLMNLVDGLDTTIQHVEFAWNKMPKTNCGVDMGTLGGSYTRWPTGINIHDNLGTDCMSPLYSGVPGTSGPGHGASTSLNSLRTEISHLGEISYTFNTVALVTTAPFASSSGSGTILRGFQGAMYSTLLYRRNVVPAMAFSIFTGGSHCAFNGAIQLDAMVLNTGGSHSMVWNLFGAGATLSFGTMACSGGQANRVPSNNNQDTSLTAPFVDAAGGNYRIADGHWAENKSDLDGTECSTTSGTDLGACIDKVDWFTATAVSGAYNPYLDFKVRGHYSAATTVTLYVSLALASDPTLEISTNGRWTDSVGSPSVSRAGRDAVITITGLTANTLYYIRLTNGSYKQALTAQTH